MLQHEKTIKCERSHKERRWWRALDGHEHKDIRFQRTQWAAVSLEAIRPRKKRANWYEVNRKTWVYAF